MTLAKRLWEESRETVDEALHHPFVQGLGDGSLPESAFKYYVGQDEFYLKSFARAYMLAGAHTTSWDAFIRFHALAQGVIDELELHRKYLGQWNVSTEERTLNPTTRRYTDFLLATAWRFDEGTTAAAMAPCMQLYGYLGHRLKEQCGGIPAHQYGEWIAAYAGEEFDALVAELEDVVNTFSPDSEYTREVYRYAMECEVAFFDAAYRRGREHSITEGREHDVG